ncbi:ace1 transcription factor [Lentinula edodes]|uniref:Ace1 transcription factor n=1 Tax=Lentinula edodes TaxID=5353 RepID=A0A1Q3E2Y5_LENED|nr:ace1 transcription factor [Lentinula edodes]
MMIMETIAQSATIYDSRRRKKRKRDLSEGVGGLLLCLIFLKRIDLCRPVVQIVLCSLTFIESFCLEDIGPVNRSPFFASESLWSYLTKRSMLAKLVSRDIVRVDASTPIELFHVKCICPKGEGSGQASNSNLKGLNKTLQKPAFPNGLPQASIAVQHLSESSSDSEYGCSCRSTGVRLVTTCTNTRTRSTVLTVERMIMLTQITPTYITRIPPSHKSSIGISRQIKPLGDIRILN